MLAQAPPDVAAPPEVVRLLQVEAAPTRVSYVEYKRATEPREDGMLSAPIANGRSALPI